MTTPAYAKPPGTRDITVFFSRETIRLSLRALYAYGEHKAKKLRRFKSWLSVYTGRAARHRRTYAMQNKFETRELLASCRDNRSRHIRAGKSGLDRAVSAVS